MNYINLVKDFQLTFDNPVLETPTIPSDRWQLKVNLISEELEELELACANNDLVEVLDALCDLQYVLSGAILEFGFQDVFNDAFKAVHESNMSKACPDMEDVEHTIAINRELGVKTSYKPSPTGQGFIVYRLEDDKTLKSATYLPVNLKPFIDGTSTEKSL